MSSFLRNLQRKYRPNRGKAEQVVRPNLDGGYSVLHPTRGWRKVSPARAALYGYAV